MYEQDHVVAMFTMGSFREFSTDPMSEQEARDFVANPPEIHKPRPQDHLRIFRLEPVEDDE